jgi:hypothetical protein
MNPYAPRVLPCTRGWQGILSRDMAFARLAKKKPNTRFIRKKHSVTFLVLNLTF